MIEVILCQLAPVCRLLRLLKLIRAIPQLQIIIQSLMQGMASILYVAILMVRRAVGSDGTRFRPC